MPYYCKMLPSTYSRMRVLGSEYLARLQFACKVLNSVITGLHVSKLLQIIQHSNHEVNAQAFFYS